MEKHTCADPFGARSTIRTSHGPATFYRLSRLEELGLGNIPSLPRSIRVLVESALRQCDGFEVTEDDVRAIAGWTPSGGASCEVPFKPARVVLQDFTGVPCVVDLAALRSAVRRLGCDPARINPVIPVDLVIDHSIQVDAYGSPSALAINVQREFERNRERYELLRWGQEAFANFRVVPPAMGIVHQVNLEYLACLVQTRSTQEGLLVYPDSLVGTDSHTTMINGLGVLGWGVGGIEAEAVMLGQPLYMLAPDVVGVKLTGALPDSATATDLVLTITQVLRAKGVVEKFVEFYGPGVATLSLADRATVANMSPEYGATAGFFPVDDETLSYLRMSGREEALVDLAERYFKDQGLYHTEDSPDPAFTETVVFDLSSVEPSIAGPKRPQDRMSLNDSKSAFSIALASVYNKQPAPGGAAFTGACPSPSSDTCDPLPLCNCEQPDKAYSASPARPAHLECGCGSQSQALSHGSVVIAAITSCTNTSNPSVMLGAALLAKKASQKGLKVQPFVKTSLAPGSRVVARYLEAAGLLTYLEALGFHIVGYGCTTCIGNSGPLAVEVARAIADEDLVVAAVLSGNRNFEGRIHPLTKANYLVSPPLVVAYALAGTVAIDFQTEPLGTDPSGNPVFLRDVWPSRVEILETLRLCVRPEFFREEYGSVFAGDSSWQDIATPAGGLFAWDPCSTYVQEPPFFLGVSAEIPPLEGISDARVLAFLGNSVTTDHISPAGSIPADSPAGHYLVRNGVPEKDFNSYGSRRGNHEVMMRGTFGNIRVKNSLVPGVEGGYTVYLPTGERMTIYDAAMRYKGDGVPLVVIAGREYGTGSSRDWAAKGTALLGVRAVIAESYERIHRSNLVGMGVLPLQFKAGENAQTLQLTGHERYSIEDIDDRMQPRQELTVRVSSEHAKDRLFGVIARIDSPVEVRYYRNGGILQAFLRDMITRD